MTVVPLAATIGAALPILYSRLATPDVASVACSVKVVEFVQPFGITVVSTGWVVSRRSVWRRQEVTLPALSIARVSISCSPSAEIVNWLPIGPSPVGWLP